MTCDEDSSATKSQALCITEPGQLAEGDTFPFHLHKPPCTLHTHHQPWPHRPLLFYLAAATTEFVGDFFAFFIIFVKLLYVKHAASELFYFVGPVSLPGLDTWS